MIELITDRNLLQNFRDLDCLDFQVRQCLVLLSLFSHLLLLYFWLQLPSLMQLLSFWLVLSYFFLLHPQFHNRMFTLRWFYLFCHWSCYIALPQEFTALSLISCPPFLFCLELNHHFVYGHCERYSPCERKFLMVKHASPKFPRFSTFPNYCV